MLQWLTAPAHAGIGKALMSQQWRMVDDLEGSLKEGTPRVEKHK
eukprot:CAMPEP_0204554964 /NCGR_PEP_ID=MMETSP0661-20131031/28500_1 /ASSEMBLY_ACC=CAM_ASM_000606 /TAXON_ID=109239 /ORGANISM="Alexandrium margalefi, Strain AMGDE01CS-322" /LENGTH=43 /DNA_ID= /DNA_START= /DNA_END= /DNA_ORIENTATION=